MKLSDVDPTKLHKVAPAQVYEWVKTGVWSKTQFKEYIDSLEAFYDRMRYWK